MLRRGSVSLDTNSKDAWIISYNVDDFLSHSYCPTELPKVIALHSEDQLSQRKRLYEIWGLRHQQAILQIHSA